MVQDHLVERHGDRLGRLEAHGGHPLLVVVDLGDLHLAHDDLLVADAEADALGKSLRLEEVTERVREGGDVGHLAVADHTRGELHARGARDTVGRGLDGRDERAIEVQSNRPAVGVLAQSQGHVGFLGRYRPFGGVL